ncbi:MAG: hypothetical protein H6907_10080 [Hyphomicrobiales bacterium]|nr:hypothetical protein [Hyphomicrobiales bacterium]MCP5372066.1 hypothetical protein [Hyphomicrobiales bacterium]
MTILIVTGMDDVHADRIIPQIEECSNHNVVRLNTDNLADNATISIDGDRWDGRICLGDSGRSFSFSEVTSIWYRKPVPIESQNMRLSTAAKSFVHDEYTALFKSLIGILNSCFWVSDYWSIQQASHKLPNLRLASALGLATPRTFVTTDPKAARRFAEDCAWHILAKPFGLTTFKHPSDPATSWDSFASAVSRESFDKLHDSIALAPTMLQEYVDKDIELRATVVGSQIFCTAIDSQKHEFAVHDWRAVDVEELGHEPYVLPADFAQKLLQFNRHYGLQFSTFDIILDKNGKYVWLECNPNGQWLWLEELTGQPISEAIANLLTEPATYRLPLTV